MCGFAGFLSENRLNRDDLSALVGRMATAIQHRGPDDTGCWVDENYGLALGHRRLSILDLSSAGHQPMVSACGRYVIVFNGEIYNHLEVRRDLNCSWRGNSDTETLLAGISHWGVAATLKKCVGMFAFALWDREICELVLARDRLGEKPLYFGWNNKSFLFGSELKALRAHPTFVGEVDRDAMALYLRRNCIPVPHSIYKGIFKLPAATILCLPYSMIAPGTSMQAWSELDPLCMQYWSAADIAKQGGANPVELCDEDAIEQLDATLRQAVGSCMLSDVPLGAFLSGGIDSSLVVALMQAQSQQPVQTFTIGSFAAQYNEAEHAKTVATHLGTNHTELYVTAEEAMAVIPRLATLYDEPFSDSSQIPTFLVSQLARQQVTVALSGDGGDELFGGYNRHSWAPKIWEKASIFPKFLRQFGAGASTTFSPQQWDKIFAALGPILPPNMRQKTPGDKIHKLANMLSADSPENLYSRLTSHWQNPGEVLQRGSDNAEMSQGGALSESLSFAEYMMYLDMTGYLPDDILVKVDRATMGVSLEARAPLLDHRLAEFAWQIPLSQKIRQGQGKWLLRQVLYRYVPQSLIDRPKMGFAVPIDEWLCGPLREWAEELLDERRLRNEGYFNPVPIRKRWNEHLSGRRNWQYQLWDILMFQAWLENNKVVS